MLAQQAPWTHFPEKPVINISPSGLAADLQNRALSGRPIRIGVVGSGMMGGDIVTQVLQMQGIVVAAIADLSVPAATRALTEAGRRAEEWRVVDTQSALDQAMLDGHVAVTQDAGLVCHLQPKIESGLHVRHRPQSQRSFWTERRSV